MIGKLIKDFAPSDTNHRNSEGDFIQLTNGDILFIYTRYDASCDDHASANLYASISKDNGESFGEPYLIYSKNDIEGATNIMSVSLMRMQNGDVGLFFLKKEGWSVCRLFLVRSSDEGKTWSKPTLCTVGEGYFVVHNARALTLKSGKIIIPSAYVEIIKDPNDENVAIEWKPAVFKCFASYDDGKTWVEEGVKPMVGTRSGHGLQEPCFVELNDGRVWCLARTDLGRIYESFSTDEGKTWEQFMPSQFTSATSPITVKRLSNGNLISFWTPVPVYNGVKQKFGECWTWGRTPYVSAISSNDKDFSNPYPIETEKEKGYAYTSLIETKDGDLLIAYCAGGEEDGYFMLNRLRIRKLSKADLEVIEAHNADIL